MAVQIGAKPDSGFDDPIGMLKDCHRRIERFLDIQDRVARQAEGRALTAEERKAVEASLRYFDESGPRHNLDEEESLFPRLQAGSNAAMLADIQRLEKEHQETSALHDQVAEIYKRWISDSHLSEDLVRKLGTITKQLLETYRTHIRMEEEVIFPYAAETLGLDALLAIGSELKARRP